MTFWGWEAQDLCAMVFLHVTHNRVSELRGTTGGLLCKLVDNAEDINN